MRATVQNPVPDTSPPRRPSPPAPTFSFFLRWNARSPRVERHRPRTSAFSRARPQAYHHTRCSTSNSAPGRPAPPRSSLTPHTSPITRHDTPPGRAISAPLRCVTVGDQPKVDLEVSAIGRNQLVVKFGAPRPAPFRPRSRLLIIGHLRAPACLHAFFPDKCAHDRSARAHQNLSR
jgi:hypothetical protein